MNLGEKEVKDQRDNPNARQLPGGSAVGHWWRWGTGQHQGRHTHSSPPAPTKTTTWKTDLARDHHLKHSPHTCSMGRGFGRMGRDWDLYLKRLNLFDNLGGTILGMYDKHHKTAKPSR